MPVGTRGPREEPEPRRPARGRAPRSSSATRTTCSCGPGHDARPRARRAAPVHGLGRADPHRLRRLPGLQPGQAADDRPRRACAFRSPVDGSRSTCSRPSGRSRSSTRSAPTSSIRSTSAWRYPATREATERSLGAHPALGAPLAGRAPGARRAPPRCSASCRAAFTPTCARGRRTETVALGFDGYAIGGLAVGEPKPLMHDLTEAGGRRCCPPTSPRYLMGVGKPEDLVEAVARGVDMFDCVLPTRNARNGQAFTPDGPARASSRRGSDARPGAAAGRLRVLRRAGASRAPTCATCSWPTSCSRTGCSRSTTSTSSSGSWRRCATAIARGRFEPFQTRFFDDVMRSIIREQSSPVLHRTRDALREEGLISA